MLGLLWLLVLQSFILLSSVVCVLIDCLLYDVFNVINLGVYVNLVYTYLCKCLHSSACVESRCDHLLHHLLFSILFLETTSLTELKHTIFGQTVCPASPKSLPISVPPSTKAADVGGQAQILCEFWRSKLKLIHLAILPALPLSFVGFSV